MRLNVIEPPPPIISVLDGRRQLHIDGDEQDEEIAGLIEVATATIDGPGGWLGRALGPQTIEIAQGCFYADGRAEIGLPCSPLIGVVSVAYDATDGTEKTIDPASYGIMARRAVYPKPGFSWPSLSSEGEVRIRYQAGWPMLEDDNDVWTGPAPIRHAILMMVSRLYAHRGEDVPANLAEDRAINALLAPYRIFQL